MTFLRRPGIGRRLTFIAVCALTPLVSLTACRVDRDQAQANRAATSVVVRPVFPGARRTMVVPRIALHQDEEGWAAGVRLLPGRAALGMTRDHSPRTGASLS
jgi:hypothetical protein